MTVIFAYLFTLCQYFHDPVQVDTAQQVWVHEVACDHHVLDRQYFHCAQFRAVLRVWPVFVSEYHVQSEVFDAGFAEALFEDVRESGTKVCTIRPGFVNTSMAASDRLDPALMIQPEDIARAVLFVLTMPETACPTEITMRPQRSPYIRT